jgi:hypothetical protein
MATPTLGGVPTTLNLCNSDNFGVDGTDSDIKKEGASSVAWLARGDGETVSYTVSNLNLAAQHIRFWINTINLPYMESFEMLAIDGSNSGWWVAISPANYEGGWKYCIIYGGSTPGRNSGTPPAMTSVDSLGLVWQQTGLPANKINTWTDAWYYGDGYYATGGTSGDKITLAGIRTLDVASAYGIVDAYQGVYFCSGALTIGNGSTTTYFQMSQQVMVFIDASVNTGLYKLVGAGSGCHIAIVGSVLRAAGSTDATRFALNMGDANLAEFSMTGSFVTRAATCTFKSGQTVTNNAFANCGQIVAAGANLSGSTVSSYEGTSNTSALIWNVNTDTNGLLDGMTFTKGTASTHAIELGTSSPTEITLTNMTFTGYNASDEQTDSAIHVKRTSGTVDINISGGYSPSVKSDGATVTIVNEVTLTLEGLIDGSEIRIYTDDTTPGVLGTTELSGTESNSGTTYEYKYEVTTPFDVVIQVLADDYLEWQQTVEIGNSNQTVTVSQQLEKNI